MNVFLHFLLVIKEMNEFTVSEAKDALMHEYSVFSDAVEARKFIYRQLTRYVERGLLKRTNKDARSGNNVLYSKTELFFNVSISPATRGNKAKSVMTQNTPNKVQAPHSYKAELQKELTEYEIDLNTILEEAKEYKRLSERFPMLQEVLQQHHSAAKTKSIKLLGKIKAIKTILSFREQS